MSPAANPVACRISAFHTMAEAAVIVLRGQMDKFMAHRANLPCEKDVEAVHQMRVATRRMRAAMRLFRDTLGHAARDVKENLSRIADALGPCRDSDVLIEFLHRHAKASGPSAQPFLAGLLAAEKRRRKQRYRNALGIMRTRTCTRFVTQFHRALRAPYGSANALKIDGEAATRPTRSEAPRVLRGPLKRVLAYPRSLDRLPGEELHLLRIDCKRLRYAAEFFADVYPDGLREVVSTMKKMQDLLGSVHDCDVYTERIRRYMRRRGAHSPARNETAGARAVLRHLEEWREENLAAASRAWRKFTRDKTQSRIKTRIRGPRRS